ncbi:MAG TPA: FecR domain-containing protein [Verrucomicrobiae bacterium]
MKDIRTSLGVLLIFGAWLLAGRVLAQTPAAAPASGDSVLLTVEGKVEAAVAGSTDWLPAHTNQTLRVGDRLRTGLRSRATVRLSNLTVLRVNELTTLQIQPPSAPGKQSSLDLEKGAAYFFSRERPTEMEFRTPLASGAIRGTEFNLAVADDGKTVVTLIDGEVALNDPQGQENLVSGEQGIVEPGKAPAKTASINALNIIQWCLYYPAVLDTDELNLTANEKQTLSASLAAYRSGDLLAALANYPANRAAISDSEKIYYAQLLLSVGQVDQSESQLGSIPSPLAAALREVVASVKFQKLPSTLNPQLSTCLLADSYYLQSRSQLEAALAAAHSAAQKSPDFGFAWERLAELEFSFGHTDKALAALEKGLQLSPRNAEAISLKGFLLAAQNKSKEARQFFDDAIAVDGALGNAWLGRGLIKIHQGDSVGGLKDLQVAAVLEPNRSVLRSYLGKAFANKYDDARAEKELRLAQKLDPNDPTSWLYLALLEQQENKINPAIEDLQQSQSLNDNRSLFRSKLLLDQDQAVRSANLALIYQDAGMNDVSVNEASRAVSDDYANYSVHQFLANSYDALRDPNQINLRYETPWLSELLVSELLAPVGADNLSDYISQQEYSRLFEQDHLGASSSTEYRSDGAWHEEASQYGNAGNFGYAFDAEYRSQNGYRPNDDLQQTTYDLKAKDQLTSKDSVMLQVLDYDANEGDVGEYYSPGMASLTERITEKQPDVFIGYHRQWSPGIDSLLLAGRLEDTFTRNDSDAPLREVQIDDATGKPDGVVNDYTSPPYSPTALTYQRQLEAYSAEFQQIFSSDSQTAILGGRFQTGSTDISSDAARGGFSFPFFLSGLNLQQQFSTELERLDFYGYYTWHFWQPLQITAGASYERLKYPGNTDIAPVSNQESERNQVSPKAGFILNPWKNGYIRGAYTRSLGGLFFDNSVRLEPTEIAGFNQAFRSAIPESVEGNVPGSRFETWGLAFEQHLPTKTYLTVSGEILKSHANRTFGVIEYDPATIAVTPSGTPETLDYKEQTLAVTISQLVGRDVSLGAQYQFTKSYLNDEFPDIPQITPPPGAINPNQHDHAILHQVDLFAIYNHPDGFFARADAVWFRQSNEGYSPAEPGDDFWQFNAYAGYRFHHRHAEIQLGLLNITDQDYNLNPLNLYNELPHGRTLSVTFKFYF